MAFELTILLVLLAATALLVAAIWFFGNALRKDGPMRDMALQKEQDIDKQGKALTVLRPAGKIEVEGTMLDAVSVHDFIDAGEPIVVTKYENTQLYVQRSK